MLTRNKLLGLGVLTYLLGMLIFLIVNCLRFLILPKIQDWQLFSFNFFGNLMFYGIAILLYLFAASIVALNKIKSYMVIVFILLSFDIISILISGQSIWISIFANMKSDENYILLAYPLVLVVSYFLSKRILKVNFE